MNYENNIILKVNIDKKELIILKIIEEYSEGFYALFYYILKNPLDNFWWECISLTIQYCHTLLFIINATVSKKYLIMK